jgi:NAD+ diphosphatase
MLDFNATHPSKIMSFCPKCGSNKYVYDNIKAFNCAACGFKYYINPAPAVAVILCASDGKIVLTRRKFDPQAGTFDLPGGFVDMMESAEKAVRREVFEELGVRVGAMQFLASFPNEYVFKGISYFTCDLAFVCPMDDLSSLNPSDDVEDAVLIDPREIDFETISFPSVVNILHSYIETINIS